MSYTRPAPAARIDWVIIPAIRPSAHGAGPLVTDLPSQPNSVPDAADTGGQRQIDTGGGHYIEGGVNTAGGDFVGGDKLTLVQAAPSGVAALHQLPAPLADFTGRAAELDRLRQLAGAPGAALISLRGMGGIGKTALAVVLAHELAADCPDAQIFLDLHGAGQPLSPAAIMAHVIRAYKPVEKLPDDPAQLAAIYHSLLNGQRALLLLDNARDAGQLRPLLPPAGCLLLFTSRSRFTLPGLQALDLDSLPPADAQALLLKIAPRLGGASAAPAAQLAELCAYLPLALRLAGSALAERDDLEPDDYARRLSAEQGRAELGGGLAQPQPGFAARRAPGAVARPGRLPRRLRRPGRRRGLGAGARPGPRAPGRPAALQPGRL